MATKRIIFWGNSTEIIKPYMKWDNVDKYVRLDWWHTYADFKHNRYDNYLEASLEKAIFSMAGLFTAILNCEFCYESMVKSGWVTSLTDNSLACLCSIKNSSLNDYKHWCVVESKLFAYPVGFDRINEINQFKEEDDWIWAGPASSRFKMWFNYHAYSQWRTK